MNPSSPPRIFLSTPLRNEIDNIERLYAAVATQDAQIDIWVIVENGSTDGSREDLAKRSVPANVRELVVLNEDTERGDYALGAKYARIVNRGFEEIRSRIELGAEDFIGILDADSFPDPDYYSTLMVAFDADPKLGIAGGISRDDGTDQTSVHAKDWVRGSCRLWRGACMLQSGYVIGPSADTLSLGRAELDGWRAQVIPGASFFAREVGTRAKHQYYGRSTYYRGCSLPYACLRASKLLARGNVRGAQEYLGGYMSALLTRKPRVADLELRAHFNGYLSRKLKRKILCSVQ